MNKKKKKTIKKKNHSGKILYGGFNGYRCIYTFTLGFCVCVLTVILVALLSALTHSTRSC